LPAMADIIVAPVNDAPSFSPLGNSTLGDTIAIIEGDGPAVLDPDVAIRDLELAALSSYAGASLTLARSSGAHPQDVFASGSALLGELTEGGALVQDGTTIGTVTQNSAGTLVLGFNTSATETLVNDALRGIAYRNSSDAPPASVELTWIFHDGNSGAQGLGSSLSDTGITTVLITGVNDAPVAVDVSATGPENAQSIPLVLSASDIDGTIAGFTLHSLPAHGRLYADAALTQTIHAGMSVSGASAYFQPDIHWSGTTSLSYTAQDDAGASSAPAVASIVVQPTNNAPSFLGGDGKLLQAVGSGDDYAQGMLLQPDGRIVLAGTSANGADNDFSLVRLNTDGSLDGGFGVGGRVIVPITGNDVANGVSLQVDGKIIVVGQGQEPTHTDSDYRVVRLNANGTLDEGFGENGTVLLPVGSNNDAAYNVITLADAKIVLVGSSVASDSDFSVVRLLANGEPDLSFSSDGLAVIPVGTSHDSAFQVQALPGDLLAIAGSSFEAGIWQFSVVQLETDGDLDLNFGSGGKRIVPVGNVPVGGAYAFGTAMVVQPDPEGQAPHYKLLIAGHAQNGASYDFALIRLNADGSVDENFGPSGDGRVLLPVGSGNEEVYAMALQADGKLLITGRGVGNVNGDFAVIRLTDNGLLDPSFGNAGTVLIPVGDGEDISHDIVVQVDGKIVLGGEGVNGATHDFGVVRLNADGSLDETFDNQRFETLGGTVGYTENGLPVVLDADVQISDIELEATGSYAGASLTLTRSGGADAQDLYSQSGELSALIEGQALVFEGVSIGTVTTNSGGLLVLSFGSGATKTLVESALRSIAYSNAGDNPPGLVQIQWSFGDGNTGSQGAGGELNATGTTTVTIAPVNDAPVAVDVTASGLEDTVVPVTLAGTDVDGTVAGYRIATIPGNGRLYADAGLTQAIVAGANITAPIVYFKPEANWNGTTGFSFTTHDDSNAESANAGTAVLLVEPVNDAPSFVRVEGDGRVRVNFGPGNSYDEARSVVIQPGTLPGQDKILVAGRSHNSTGGADFGLVRLNADGSLDQTFDGEPNANGNGNGIVRVNFGPGITLEDAYSVVIQPGTLPGQDKILVAGYSYNSAGGWDIGLVRLNSDGSLDQTFDGEPNANGNGIVRVNFGPGRTDDYAYSVVIQPGTLPGQDKILVAGRSHNSAGGWDIGLVRLNSDGSLDQTFDGEPNANGNGIVRVNFGPGRTDDYAYSVVIQPGTLPGQDKILIAGYSYNNAGGADFELVRLNSDGSLDQTFDGEPNANSNGIVRVNFGPGNTSEYANSVVIQPGTLPGQDKILIAGHSYNNAGGADFGLVRLNSDGSLDQTFDGESNANGNGIVRVNFGPGRTDDYAYSVAIQPDLVNPKIVAVGISLYPIKRNLVRCCKAERRW
jgi:uncharacterized delta-60 repeat protein